MTPADFALLKQDILARANLADAVAAADDQAIADWYNETAQTGDFATPLKLWKPRVSIQEINAVVDWTAQPAYPAVTPNPATDTDKLLALNAQWMKWQSMTWAAFIDMTDPQVRQGIDSIWGQNSTTATGLKTIVGKLDGARFQVLLSGAGVGGARVSRVFGETLTPQQVSLALRNS